LDNVSIISCSKVVVTKESSERLEGIQVYIPLLIFVLICSAVRNFVVKYLVKIVATTERQAGKIAIQGEKLKQMWKIFSSEHINLGGKL
jgi:hypothetical protein